MEWRRRESNLEHAKEKAPVRRDLADLSRAWRSAPSRLLPPRPAPARAVGQTLAKRQGLEDLRAGSWYHREAMKEIAPRITVDPIVRHGKPVIAGTRVPVATVVSHLASGWEIERVADEFAITRDDVLAALQYAARILEQEEVRAVS